MHFFRVRLTSRLPLVALFPLVAAALAGCAGNGPPGDGGATTTAGPTTTSTVAGDCSAAHLSADLEPQAGLPEPVEETRQRIVDAAVACDYEELAEIAGEGEAEFTFSFGGGDDAAAFFEREEDAGRRPLEILVELLQLPHAERPTGATTQYVWPEAFAYDGWDRVPEEAKEDLAEVYGEEELEAFAQAGAYLGHRVGIASDGEWLFFVAGD